MGRGGEGDTSARTNVAPRTNALAPANTDSFASLPAANQRTESWWTQRSSPHSRRRPFEFHSCSQQERTSFRGHHGHPTTVPSLSLHGRCAYAQHGEPRRGSRAEASELDPTWTEGVSYVNGWCNVEARRGNVPKCACNNYAWPTFLPSTFQLTLQAALTSSHRTPPRQQQQIVTLSLANNHFTSLLPISPWLLTTHLPNLENVSFANNSLNQFRDLDPFSPLVGKSRADGKQKGWPNLKELVLKGNPMAQEGSGEAEYQR